MYFKQIFDSMEYCLFIECIYIYRSHQNCPYETGIRIMPNQMHQCNQPCHNAKYLESTVYKHGQDKREPSGPQTDKIYSQ